MIMLCFMLSKVMLNRWRNNMKRRNAQTIGEAIRDFFSENPAFYNKVLEASAIDAWKNKLSPGLANYTQNIYVRDHVLYVSLSSSVLRNELMLNREHLIRSLNAAIGEPFLRNIILR